MLDKVVTINDLSWYLGTPSEQLITLQPESYYITFTIPKPGTPERRTIEAPTGILKHILEKLSDGLQWIYSDHRTYSAHGYIRSVKNDPDKRSIFTNARRHLGKKYMLNIDLESFFHQIDERKVKLIFSHGQFFSFNTETEDFLTKMVCYHGRISMGSPASPPLSNFATIDLDKELELWTRHQRIIYTRFVDDLSFSSDRPISEKHFEIITDFLNSHQFSPNPNKIKWYGPTDIKEVTGLIVGSAISLPKDYLVNLEKEIKKLKELKSYIMQYPDYSVMEWIQKLEQVIGG